MTVIYLIDSAGALTGPVTLPVIPGIGIQLPSNAIELEKEPTAPERNHVLAWIEGKVITVADNRGPVFSIATGLQEQWTALGELPEGYTTVTSPGPFHVWVNSEWQLNDAALEASKAVEVLAVRDDQLRLAALRIAPLQDAHDLGDISEVEESLLTSWKRYRVALNRIEQQEGYPINVIWPPMPGAAEPQ